MSFIEDEWKGAGARLSLDRIHRYWLTRFGLNALFKNKTILFCLLNPSRADGKIWDTTLRKCCGFAQIKGYNRVVLVNLFSYRATDPRRLLQVERLGKVDITGGTRNLSEIISAAEEADAVVCAWGRHAYATKERIAHVQQVTAVLRTACESRLFKTGLFSLGETKDGYPPHPLMLPYSTKLRSY